MLYRRPGSRFWWLRFTTPDGKEVRRSTGTEDQKDAEEYEARLKLDLWRVARLGERLRHTWKEAVVRWVEEMAHKASHEDDLAHLRWLDAHLGALYLDQIDRERLRGLVMARKLEKARLTGKPVTNATVNRMLSVVHAILRRAAMAWDWLGQAPTIPLLPETARRIRWLTREEADRLLLELPEHLAEMMRFSLATGLRERNVTGLEWAQVDLAQRVAWIHPDQAKARKAIGISLNRDAVLVLRRQQGRHPTRVFTFQGQPVVKAGANAWRKALARAGITGFRWHDLRHTWASWHVQAGTPLQRLMEMGGWSSLDMVLRYAHLEPHHLEQDAARIETPLRTLSGTAAKEKATEVA